MAKQRWQHIKGPDTIFSIARAGELGWMIGTDEGVWKLVDGKCSIVAEALRPAPITAVAVSPDFPRHPLAYCGATDGIAMSADEGLTWQGTQLPQLSQISQIVLSPSFTIDRTAFAVTMQDGILTSVDYGASWTQSNLGLLDHETVALAVSPTFATDSLVIASTVHGVFRSASGGRAWRELQFPSGANPVSSLAFAGQLLLAGSETQGLYYSVDAGNTWTKRSSFKSGQISAVAASLDGTTVAVATPAVVASSSDQGLNWQRAEGRPPHAIMCLAVDNRGALLVGTQGEGLWLYQ